MATYCNDTLVRNEPLNILNTGDIELWANVKSGFVNRMITVTDDFSSVILLLIEPLICDHNKRVSLYYYL